MYRWAYDYSKPGADDDFIPQNVPDEGQVDPLDEPNPGKFEHTHAATSPNAEKDVVMFSALKKLFGFAR